LKDTPLNRDQWARLEMTGMSALMADESGENSDLLARAAAGDQEALESRQFRSALRRAVREIIHQSPELAPVRVRISV
jgi:hypothetical protein